MKTKQEIEQLAKQLCNIPIDLVINEEERYYKNFQKYDGIIQGYTKCQEYMADKKYTEEDIKEAAYFFVSKKLAANQDILDEEIQDFINSLNKQD